MSKDIFFGRAIFSQVFKVILHQVFTPSGKTSKLSFLSLPLNLHGTLFLSTSMAAPSQPYYGVFRPLSGKDFNPQTTSLHWLPFPILKITQYHLHLHLFQDQSKWFQSCSLNFWFLLLVLVILMMDHVVFIELRIILVMDHVGVEARVRVLC